MIYENTETELSINFEDISVIHIGAGTKTDNKH